MTRRMVCLVALAAVSAPLSAQSASDLYQRAVMVERTTTRLDSAIVLYQHVIRLSGPDRLLAARALLALGRAYETLGRVEARGAYERLLRDYADQREQAAQARVRIAALDPPSDLNRQLGSGGVSMIRRVSGDRHQFSSGTVSPNGRYFSNTNGETGDLAIYDLSTGVNRLLTANDRTMQPNDYAEYSMISPNGLEIAYVWYTEAFRAPRYELRVVPLRGGVPRSVAIPDVTYLELYGWAPDGKHLLAVVKSDTSDVGALALIDIEHAVVRRLRMFSFLGALGASISPDGKWIAFSVPMNDELGRSPSIRIMGIDGSNEHVLVDHPSANWRPMWTPDGRGIAFQSDRTGSVALWFVEVVDGIEASEPVVLMSDVRGEGFLGFARDGRLFYTPTTLRDISVATLDMTTGELASAPRVVAKRFVGSNINPDWSSDGTRLTFVSMRGPGLGMAPQTRVLAIVDMSTGEQREFSPRLRVFQHPRWSRDGRSILLVGRALDGRNGFFLLDVGTGALDVLTTSPHIPLTPAEWSADGTLIFYARTDSAGAGSSLWGYHLTQAAHRPVHAPDSLQSVRAIAASMDGQWLGFNATYRRGSGPRSMALSFGSGEPHELLTGPGYNQLISYTAADVLGLRYRAADSVTELWRVSRGGEATRKLLFESRARMIGWPRISANGSRIAFPVVSDDPNASGIWMMENFLPVSNKTKR